MTSLCHGTLTSASALQGVALALALALESVALLTSLVWITDRRDEIQDGVQDGRRSIKSSITPKEMD